jgi:hypothetical protein
MPSGYGCTLLTQFDRLRLTSPSHALEYPEHRSLCSIVQNTGFHCAISALHHGKPMASSPLPLLLLELPAVSSFETYLDCRSLRLLHTLAQPYTDILHAIARNTGPYSVLLLLLQGQTKTLPTPLAPVRHLIDEPSTPRGSQCHGIPTSLPP